MVSMYDKFGEYLKTVPNTTVHLKIDFIESLVGELPPSARWDRTWWGNSKHHSRTHARAWMDAGWKVAKGGVDFGNAQITFERIR